MGEEITRSTKARHRRRLCRRLMGILLPIVRGGAWIVIGCCWPVEADEEDDADGEYGRSKRLTVGLDSNGIGLASVQSAGAGRGSKPSTVASGITMLMRFST